jgi:hypothetical protein
MRKASTRLPEQGTQVECTLGLRQRVKGVVAVRCRIIVRRGWVLENCARPAKRRRALLESNLSRNSRLELIASDERRERAQPFAPCETEVIGAIDSPCLRKLMHALSRLACASRAQTPRADDSPAPNAGVPGCRSFPGTR